MDSIQYTLYIGADNKTDVVNKHLIMDICTGYFENLTYQEGLGVWKDGKENCAIVTIIQDRLASEQIYALAEELCARLQQEAILVTSFPVTYKLCV